MLSSPVYAYGINLLPAERVAEEVMKCNAQLAQVGRETGASFTLYDLDQRFQALLQQLEDTDICHRGGPYPPILMMNATISNPPIRSHAISQIHMPPNYHQWIEMLPNTTEVARTRDGQIAAYSS
jgi:hypothetical protein